MTQEQTDSFAHMHRLNIPRNPWNASQFLSLSPIYFTSEEELLAKLATYKQRPRNKNRQEREDLQDNSSANRGYVLTGTRTIHYRAYFEHQRQELRDLRTSHSDVSRYRTLYHLMSGRIAPGKFALPLLPWLGAIRVVSIVFVQWAIDNRPRAQRLDDPNLIEVGYTDALFPNFFDTLAGTTFHMKLKKKKANVKNPHSKVTQQFGLYSFP